LPILGGAAVLALGETRAQAARWTSLVVALAVFALSLSLFTGFDHAASGMQFVERMAWIPAYDIQYHLGVDGISIALIILTTLTTALVLVGAWTAIDRRVNQYYASMLILEGLM